MNEMMKGGYCRVPNNFDVDVSAKVKARAIGTLVWVVTRASRNDWVREGCRVGRGQLVVSIKSLAPQLGMTHHEMRNVLDALCRANLLTKEATRVGATTMTLLTVCNYDDYNGEMAAAGKEAGKGCGKDAGSLTEEGKAKEGKTEVEKTAARNLFGEEATTTSGRRSGKRAAKEGRPAAEPRGADGEPRGAGAEPRGTDGEPRGAGAELRGADGEPRGADVEPRGMAVEVLAERLMEPSAWRDQYMLNTGIGMEEMRGLLGEFARHLQNTGVSRKDMGDAMRHFCFWHSKRREAAERMAQQVQMRTEVARRREQERREEARLSEERYRERMRREEEEKTRRIMAEIHAAAAAGDERAIRAMEVMKRHTAPS